MKGGVSLSYRVRSFQIHSDVPLYGYLETVSGLVNNLYNATLFRIRNVMTAVKKEPGKRHELENEVMEELEAALPKMGDKYHMPTGKYLPGYEFMRAWMHSSGNPDYFAEGLRQQIADYAVRVATRDMANHRLAMRSYSADPSKFTGKPKLPHYKHKQGLSSFIIPNQSARLYPSADGKHSFLHFPKTKLFLDAGYIDPSWKLKETTVKPANGIFTVNLVFDAADAKPVSDVHERIVAVDPGINNLMAVTNNFGEPCLLFNGRILKSVNQLYNKTIACLMSEQTKGGSDKYVPGRRYHAATLKRNNQVADFMHKAAKALVLWCVEHRTDTIVLGYNRGWKQKTAMSKRNNQNFVQLPFQKLYYFIEYLAASVGISVVRQEESYTSKASFLDDDAIPVYGAQEDIPAFSGQRTARGIYRSADGTRINADLNGSANILRKAFPEAFSDHKAPEFFRTQYIQHPDQMLFAHNK